MQKSNRIRTVDIYIEQQTWVAVQQGNKEAFELLYNKTVLHLTNHAYRVIKDEELVKDILQDVYVSLYTKRNKLPADLNVPGYLYNAVKYKVSTFLRDELSKKSHFPDLLKQARLAESSQPDLYEKTELSNQIRAGIYILPEKCRQAFILSHYDNLTYKAIAHKMGISVKTVEKHISKALQLLRKELNEESIYMIIFAAIGYAIG